MVIGYGGLWGVVVEVGYRGGVGFVFFFFFFFF